MPGNEEWQSFWQRAGEDASAAIRGTFMMNVPVVAKSQQVHMVFSWDVQQGQTPSFLALCQQSRKYMRGLVLVLGYMSTSWLTRITNSVLRIGLLTVRFQKIWRWIQSGRNFWSSKRRTYCGVDQGLASK